MKGRYSFLTKSLILMALLVAVYCFSKAESVYAQEEEGTWTNHYGLSGGPLAFDESTGKMWMGNSAGLIEFELPPAEHTRYTKANGLPSHNVYSIASGQSGRRWINTYEGLLYIDADKRWETFRTVSATLMPGGQVLRVGDFWNRTIVTDKDGNAWLPARAEVSGSRWEEGVVKLSADGQNLFYLIDGEGVNGPIDDINSIFVHKRDNVIWFGTEGGASVLYPSGQWTDISHFSGKNIQEIAVDGQGDAWAITLPTPGGGRDLIQRTSNGSTVPHISNIFPNVFNADHGDNIWVDGYQSILRYDLRTSKWITYTQQDDGLLSTSIRSMEPDAQGNMWFSTHNGLMSFTSRGSWEMYPYSPQQHYALVPNAVYDIKGHEDALWFGSHRLFYFHDNKWASPPISPGSFSRDFEFARDGSLWTTSHRGVIRVAPDETQTCPNIDGLCDSTVFDIYQDEDSTLWFGTDRGVYRFKDRNWKTYTTEDGLVHNEVRTIAKDLSDEIWFGTAGGISILKDTAPISWTTYATATTNLLSSNVRNIVIDQVGDKWIATDSGVNRVSADGSTWNTLNNLPSNDVHRLFVDTTGNIWIGTVNGVTQISPDFLFRKEHLRGHDVRAIYIDQTGANWWFGTIDTGVWHYSTAPRPQPDLTVEVVTDPITPTIGGPLVYIINYANNGEQDAVGVKLSMIAQPYTTFSQANSSPTIWTCPEPPITPICTTEIGTLAAGDSGSVRFGVNVNSLVTDINSKISYVASISSDEANGLDANPDDNSAGGKTAIANPALIINKAASPTNLLPGETVYYTVTVSTNSEVQIALTDTIPISVTDRTFPVGSYEQLTGLNGNLYVTQTVKPDMPLQFAYQGIIDTDVRPGTVLHSGTTVRSSDIELYTGTAVAVGQKEPVPLLVLIVANGDNNLGPYIRQLMQRAEIAADNQSIVTYLFYDGPNSGDAYIYQIQQDSNWDEFCPSISNPDCDGRYIPHKTMWPMDENISEKSQIREFLASHIEANPADKVAVTFVGHGAGISPNFYAGQPSFHEEKFGGMLLDENPDSYLSTKALGETLDAVKARTGRTIDLLYLDMCLMAVGEVLYEVKDSVRYVLASQNWSWTSFRYDKHLAVDGNLDIVTIAEKWMQHEAEELTGTIKNGRTNYPFTYSLLDLQQMDAFVQQDNALTQALSIRLKADRAGTIAKITKTRRSTHCFDAEQDYSIDEKDYYCDVFSFASQLIEQFGAASDVGKEAQTLIDLIRRTDKDEADRSGTRLLIKELHNGGNPPDKPDQRWAWEGFLGGVSKYMPLAINDSNRSYYNPNHVKFTVVSQWDEFLTDYWIEEEIPEPEKCETDCAIGPVPIGGTKAIYLPLVVKDSR